LEPKHTQIALKATIDDDVAQGTYANFINVWHTYYEFVIDFGRVVPGRKEFKIFTRIITNPLRAKLFLKMLESHIGQYEKMFGKIDIDRHQFPEVEHPKLH